MTIGELINQYCASHGITKQQFAQNCNVSKGYISMLINGKNPKTGKPIKPTIETYNDIATAMGMTIHELFETIDDAPVTLNTSKKIIEIQEYQKPSETYYDSIIDDEMNAIREDFRRNPELRTLFNLQRKATKQELRQMEAFIRAIRSSNDHED